jgi:hypothetical protein
VQVVWVGFACADDQGTVLTIYHHVSAIWMIATGTPIQNHLGELWGILNVLDPERVSCCINLISVFLQ